MKQFKEGETDRSVSPSVFFAQILPAEAEDGYDDGKDRDRFAHGAAPGMHNDVIEQSAGRSEELGETDLLCVLRPVADAGDGNGSERQEASRTGPGEGGHACQQKEDHDKRGPAAGPFPLVGFQKEHISGDIDDQTECAGVGAHQKELDHENDAAGQLADEQCAVGSDLIGNDEQCHPEEPDGLDDKFIHNGMELPIKSCRSVVCDLLFYPAEGKKQAERRNC